MSEAPYVVVARSLKSAQALYAKHAVAWTLIGGIAAFASAYTFTSATRLSGMFGGVAFALPVGLFMGWRWWSVRDDGPLVRLLRDEPQRIVWTYVKIHAVHSRGGQEIRRTHEVALGRDDGKKVSFYVDDAVLERVVEAIAEIAPHATTGYTEANEDLFADDPTALKKVREPEGGAYRDPPKAGDAKPIRRGRRRRARRIQLAIALGTPAALLVFQIGGALWTAMRTSEAARVRVSTLNELFATSDREVARLAASHPTADALPRFETACAGRVTFPITVLTRFYETSPTIAEKQDGTLRSFRPGTPTMRNVGRAGGMRVDTSYFFWKALFRLPWNWSDMARSWGSLEDIPSDSQIAVVTLLGADEARGVEVAVRISDRATGTNDCTGLVVANPEVHDSPTCLRMDPTLRRMPAMARICDEGRKRQLVEGIQTAVADAIAAARP